MIRRPLAKSVFALIVALTILTSCSNGSNDTTKPDPGTLTTAKVTSTTTSPKTKDYFLAERVSWVEYCFPQDSFCAKFPMFPGQEKVEPQVVDPKKLDPPAEGRVFTAYTVDTDMAKVDGKLVYCPDIMNTTCEADTSHGVPSDSYGVFVGPDDSNGQTLDAYDWENGDCGPRPNRKVSTVEVNGLKGTKITCTYSYNENSFRTLYYFRYGGKLYEINASNQTAKPYFGDQFLASFEPIKP